MLQKAENTTSPYAEVNQSYPCSMHARGDGSFGWQVARLCAKEKALLLAIFLSEACDLSSGISQLRNQLVICLLLHWEAGHMSTEAATLAAKHGNTFTSILLTMKCLHYYGNGNGQINDILTDKKKWGRGAFL